MYRTVVDDTCTDGIVRKSDILDLRVSRYHQRFSSDHGDKLSVHHGDDEVALGAIQQRTGGALAGMAVYLPAPPRNARWEIVQDDQGLTCLVLVKGKPE